MHQLKVTKVKSELKLRRKEVITLGILGTLDTLVTSLFSHSKLKALNL